MTITRQDVATVAHLSRLELDEATTTKMTAEMDKILAYVHKLDELDTSEVEPTAQVTVDASPLRKDERRSTIDKQQALASAPRSDEAGFLVPGFVDES